MATEPDSQQRKERACSDFRTTHWSVVVAAGRRSSPESREALQELCQQYWYPIYAFVRRSGHQVAEARDLTQGFFLELLDKDVIRSADADRGRFRSFLLTVLKRYIGRHRERAAAFKRGGGMNHWSLDFHRGEERYRNEPHDHWSPEKIFQRRWAITLLDHVLANLQSEYARNDNAALFEHFCQHLTGDEERANHTQLAAELEMTEGAVKAAMHRMRQRYRELLRAEVRKSVADDGDVLNELDILLNAVRGET